LDFHISSSDDQSRHLPIGIRLLPLEVLLPDDNHGTASVVNPTNTNANDSTSSRKHDQEDTQQWP
jgi:hypothetical protein